MTLSSGDRLGPYEVLAPLGAGGMGEVYRARDTRLHREVAIKVLPSSFSQDPDRLRRFEQEARAASALNHPGILTIHDFGAHDSTPYVVSELLEGGTLRERLAAGALAPRKAVEYGVQIANGLAAAHEKGIIHRDLKPENVFVTEDGRVKILDFGLAKLTRPELDRGATNALTEAAGTEPGVVMGTVGYMSPEQVRGQPADRRSDLFAFGTLLFEMLTGRRAFRGDTAVETMNAILKEEPAEVSATARSVSPALERIVRRCLEKSPSERFQSARDLAFALTEASGSWAVATLVPPPGRRHALALAVSAAILAAVVLIWNIGGLRDRFRYEASPARIQSLAVLPLDNLSRDPEQEYFADGMTEELITNLAQIRALRVISRTSVMAYKGARKPLPQIGRELDVDAIVEGSVVKSGERVRITAQLIEVATDRHLWAKSYERDLKDALSLQSEIARAVASEIRAALTPDEKARLAKPQPVDPEVHKLYLQGRYHWNKGAEPEIRRAIEFYERALARDPRSALAYAGIAEAWVSLTDHFLPPLETMPRAKAAAIRALELDETLAESHVALGNVYLLYDWNWSDAEKKYRRAIELNPGYAEAHGGYGHSLAVVGRHAESAAEMTKARELDPRSVFVHTNSGWALLLAGRVDESIAVSRKAVELDASFGWTRVNLAIAYVEKGLLADAVSEAERGIENFDSPLARATAGTVFAAAGDRKRALRVLDELAAISSQRYVCPYEVALVHLGLGDRDEAFRWLEKGFRDRSVCMVYTKYDPRLRPVHGDPRYVDLVRRIGFPQ